MTGSGPREGIYLDAALSSIEHQVNDRLDMISGRRRMLTRGVIVGLLATTLGAGAATAAALTYSAAPTVRTVTLLESEADLHCVQGALAGEPAYFTARLVVHSESGSTIDAAAICSTALTAITDRGETLAHSTPDELIREASYVLATAVDPSFGTATVREASFGTVMDAATGPVRATTCERVRDGRIVVLVTARDGGATSAAPGAVLCSSNAGYTLSRGAR